MIHRIRRILAVPLAFALLAMSAGASLAASTSSTTNMTLQVNSTLSLTGVPAAMDFGSGLGGTNKATPAQTSSIVAQTNLTTGLKLNLSISDLTRVGGSETIAATNYRLSTSSQPSAADCPNAPAGLASTSPNYPGGQWTICSRTSAGSLTFPGGTLTWNFLLGIPAGATPGSYTGTAVWTALET